MLRVSYFIEGLVQGVGFRPFIYKIAHRLSLVGFVKNSSSGVEVEVVGLKVKIEKFEKLLYDELPPLAKIESLKREELELKHSEFFEILQSDNSSTSLKTALISPDIAICKECLQDIKNKQKYRDYFATNCTNCGPRYSIVIDLPYDRANTSMQKFEMCLSCQEEYTDPQNRRYHAQPISCNSCGPRLTETIQETAKQIKSAKVVAIKGIGGFHIVCDTANGKVIQKLREYKNRLTKPFAIMCRDIDMVKSLAVVSEKEQELLESKEAPIVILKKLSTSPDYVAPNIDKVGCFLPYTALHYLLFEHLENPIVATSANLADEPIIISA
jgi:hydrogenase maturation protein HypF